MAQLTDLPGVGEATAETLRDVGYGSITAVADETDPAVLAETVTRWNEEQATEAITRARDIDADGDRGTPSRDPAVNVETSVDISDTRVTMSRNELYHLQHVVLEEATKQRQRSAHDEMQAAYDVARLVGDVITTLEASPHNDIGFPLPADETLQLSLHRACGQGISDYRSRQGISGVYAIFDTLKETVADERSA